MWWIDKKNVLTILVGLLIVAAIGILSNILALKQEGYLTPIKKAEEKDLIPLKTKKLLEITVREDSCLSQIAQSLGTNWQKIAEINNLKNPNLIQPKQKLMVPVFDQTNIVKVSWYGPKFHGKRMANGEIFDMNNSETAAHKWLPFNKNVRLTRIDNNKNVEVYIKDRGPYIKGRTFDLSRAAAEKLGMIDEGVITCKVEILD